MEEQWIGHMIETEEGRVSCLVDVGLAESAPDASRPLATLVRIPFKDPGEHGFGSEEERSTLGDFEDTMQARMQKHKAVHAASVRGGGVLDVWYYSPAGLEDQLRSIAKDVCKGYDVKAGSNDDPEWEMYEDLFPSPDAIAEFHDNRLISVLSNEGDQLDRERPVDHALNLPSKAAADQAAKAAAKLGYKETERHEIEGEELPITLQLTKVHNVEPDTVTARRAELTQLAEQLDGVYDGWQTPIVK